jgi:FkbM family methyltransferase
MAYSASESTLWVEIGKRRYLKRLFTSFLPQIGCLTLSPEFKIYLDLGDWTGPSFYLMLGGPWSFENYEAAEKKEIVRRLPPGGIFLDVGANIGLYSLYIKRHRPDTQVYAFEPHPLLAECLRKTVRANPAIAFTPFECGLGEGSHRASLHFHLNNSGGHSFIPDSIAPADTYPVNSSELHRSAPIQIYALDEVAQRENWSRVDFLKVDVQDMEDQFLRGARLVIRKFFPSLLIECGNRRLAEDPLYAESFATAFFDRRELPKYRWFTFESPENSESFAELQSFARQQLAQGRLYTDYFFVVTRESPLER